MILSQTGQLLRLASTSVTEMWQSVNRLFAICVSLSEDAKPHKKWTLANFPSIFIQA